MNNMTRYYAQFAEELLETRYAAEMWKLFEAGELTLDSELTGLVEEDLHTADVDSVMAEIQQILRDEEKRRERLKADSEDDEH